MRDFVILETACEYWIERCAALGDPEARELENDNMIPDLVREVYELRAENARLKFELAAQVLHKTETDNGNST